MREQSRKNSWSVAFCALMAALGAVIMTAGGLIPIATYCSPMIAGVLLLPVISELGNRWAWMTWAVTAARRWPPTSDWNCSGRCPLSRVCGKRATPECRQPCRTVRTDGRSAKLPLGWSQQRYNLLFLQH